MEVYTEESVRARGKQVVLEWRSGSLSLTLKFPCEAGVFSFDAIPETIKQASKALEDVWKTLETWEASRKCSTQTKNSDT